MISEIVPTEQSRLPHSLQVAPDQLEELVASQLEHVADAYRRGLRVYESLKSLNDVIGTQYGDRVLYELVQNAHDAHSSNEPGEIAVRLSIRSETDADLFVANRGAGFSFPNLDAIRNIGTSSKEVGDGIGNKGLGFRSVEALTDDVQVYSQLGQRHTDRFSGYCFRFATVEEIASRLASFGIPDSDRQSVAAEVPRYLVALPAPPQSEDVRRFAQDGYATVVALPLRTTAAVELAKKQVMELLAPSGPLLLFLDRIQLVKIQVEEPSKTQVRRELTRRSTTLGPIADAAGTRLEYVDLGDGEKYLVVRREADKEKVLAAVSESIAAAPQLKRWLDWKGDPVVSVAVPLREAVVQSPRLYNFLPMDVSAAAPLLGHLDAPFFADIDRRTIKADLPLNRHLLSEAALACAAAAKAIPAQFPAVPPHCVVDLVCWAQPHTQKLSAALATVGSSLAGAELWPVVEGGSRKWSSLKLLHEWPQVATKYIKPERLARVVNAAILSPTLGTVRADRIRELAKSILAQLTPKANELARWMEGLAADLLVAKGDRAYRWDDLYEDIVSVYRKCSADLASLRGKSIIVAPNRKLKPALAAAADGSPPVFVRPSNRRQRTGVGNPPLPPSSLSRKWNFLDERVNLSDATFAAFEQAGLLRKYDAIEILKGLDGSIGTAPTEAQRRDALVWAFRVWRSDVPGVEQVLGELNLHVPCASGWLPAADASYPSSWHQSEKLLEDYLLEASALSADCAKSIGRFLIPFAAWPRANSEDRKVDWTDFLELLRVNKGLQVVAAQAPQSGTANYVWHRFFRNGDTGEGFGTDWVKASEHVSLDHPQTDYVRDGQAWRLPGQIEYHQLSDNARHALSELILEYLKKHGDRHFHFSVLHYRHNAGPQLLTPLASFVRHRPWLASQVREDVVFKRPCDTWSTQTPRVNPPRFVARFAPDTGSRAIITPVLFDERIGLRDWSAIKTAPERLNALAAALDDLSSAERRVLRDQLRAAWQDVADQRLSLPSSLALVVERHSELVALARGEEAKPVVFVTSERQGFAARALTDQGEAVLDVGDNSARTVVELLTASGSFDVRLASDITLLVDGTPFTTSASDPFLVSGELDWLGDAAILGHEYLGDPLERRNTPAEAIEAAIRQVRVRWCSDYALHVSGRELRASAAERYYYVADAHRPTLIAVGSRSWNLHDLIDCAPALAKLIGTRSNFMEIILSRIGREAPGGQITRPTDEQFAHAVRREAGVIQEHIAASRGSLERTIRLVLPVVACLLDLEAAQHLASLDASGSVAALRKWLVDRLGEHVAADVWDAVTSGGDQGEIRALLKIDFVPFNAALVSLGYPPLNNRQDFERLFEVYLHEARPALLERLRRRYYAAFSAGDSLAEYTSMKELPFIHFDPDWPNTMEVLDRDFIDTYFGSATEAALGPDDTSIKLPDGKTVSDANCKLVVTGHAKLARIIQAWCRKNEVSWTGLANLLDAQSLLRVIEKTGLLDFDPIDQAGVIKAYVAVAAWPTTMPLSSELSTLGLTDEDLDFEERVAKEEKRRQEIARRSISFAGKSLDTGDVPSFAAEFADLAETALGASSDWFQRSTAPRLQVQVQPDSQRRRSGGPGAGNQSGRSQPPDSVLNAMGMASEYLARAYLQKFHAKEMSDDCWVSTNRKEFCGGSVGKDSLGYDFRVVTQRYEYLYEVKSALDEGGEFELTAREIEVAGSAAADGKRRYRILYVPFVFDPTRWRVLRLQNPVGELTRNRYRVVRSGSVRYSFDLLSQAGV